MIINDFLDIDDNFLKELREYFSSYGTIYACKYCHETNFDYFLVEFADFGKLNFSKADLAYPSFFQIKSIGLFSINHIILINKNYS